MTTGLTILKELNNIFVELRTIDKKNMKEYKNICKERFQNLKYNIKLSDQLVNMIRYMQIEHIDKKIIPSHEQVLEELKKGNLIISSYGRSFIDISTSGGTLFDKIESEKENLNNLREKITSHVLVLMSILIALLVFIFQGVQLTTKTDFLSICFTQQLQTAFALYIPLLFIGIIFFVLFIVYKILEKYFLKK